MKRNLKFIAPILCTGLLFACSNDEKMIQEAVKEENTIENQKVADEIKKLVTYEDEDFYSDWENDNPTFIELKGESASFKGDGGVVISKSQISIRSSGVYVISGKLNDGQIVVDTDSKDNGVVRLVLNGADIQSSSNAPIFVKNAEKTIVSLEEGTNNSLSDAENYVYEDSSEDEPNAPLFSKDDLTINGTGSLVVKGNYNNGIVGKDDLKITGGKIEIVSVDDGIVGRDILAVKKGTISIQAGGDGMKSTNDKDATKGAIVIEGGSFDLASESDGIQAETKFFIAGGNFNISSGGGSPETVVSQTGPGMMPGRDQNSGGNNESSETNTESTSAKGLKAGGEIVIGGGSFDIDSLDDAVHSNNSVMIASGEFEIATGDDGIHADSSVLIEGGKINIQKSYEGLEGKVVTIADGEIDITASDDGINISGGNDGSGMDMQVLEGGYLHINGGHLSVNAGGDGLDSNGSIVMTDGTVLIHGPISNGDGAIDYNGNFNISGGVLIAAGGAGMAQATSEESTQHAIFMTYPETQAAGTVIHLEDSEGNTITTFKPAKDYQTVVISTPNLTKDQSYILYSGGKAAGIDTNGLYTEGEYQDGTKLTEFTITESITWLNESGITTPSQGGFRGPGGGQGQGTPPGGEMPEGMPPDNGQGSEGGRGPGGMFDNLDEETMVKVQEIMEQERAGTITREEAQAQLAELGIEIPGGRR